MKRNFSSEQIKKGLTIPILILATFLGYATKTAVGQVPGKCVANCGGSTQRESIRERDDSQRTSQQTYPHVVRAANGKLQPEPGYRWVSDVPGDFRVVPIPGIIVSADGKLRPAPGYEWASDAPDDFRVRLTSERIEREERAARDKLERENAERERREAEERSEREKLRMGNAGVVRGDVEIFRESREPLHLEMGGTLYVGDRVRTGHGGHLQILLRDETVFTLGEDADMILDEFVYDPENGDPRKIAVRVLKGFFRFVTGKVARLRTENMKVNLAVGAIGPRGTDFQVTVLPNGSGFIQLISGSLEITEKKTRRVFQMAPMQMVLFTANGRFGAPTRMRISPTGEPETPTVPVVDEEVRFNLDRSDPDYPFNVARTQFFDGSRPIINLGVGEVTTIWVKPGERWASGTHIIGVRALVTTTQVSAKENPLPPTKTEESDVFIISRVSLEIVRVLIRPGQTVHPNDVLMIVRRIGN